MIFCVGIHVNEGKNIMETKEYNKATKRFQKVINCFDGTEYEFLSNFYVEKHGKTTEHLYQSAKAVNFSDVSKILEAETPGQAKRIGQKVELRSDWEEVKVPVMRAQLLSKFMDEDLKAKLLATGDAKLIEGNTWHDNFWGNCTCEKCANIEGMNMLGQLLMEIREQFKLASE